MDYHPLTFPTGIEDVDREILARLNVGSINQVKIVNKYVYNLIDSQFWRLKFIHEYVYLGLVNYKELYYRVHQMDDYDMIIYAAEQGHINLVSFILNRQSSAKYAEIALFAAIKNDKDDITNMLLDIGTNIRSMDDMIFIMAADRGNMPLLNKLIKLGAKIFAHHNLALFNAARSGHIEVVKLLIDHKVDIHTSSDFVIVMASEGGNVHLVKMLLDLGIDIGAYNNEALIRAIKSNNIEILQLLLDHGADINTRGGESISNAIISGNIHIITLLLDMGANIHTNCNLLLLAIGKCNPDIVNLLLERGVLMYDEAIIDAARNDNVDIIQLLLNYNCNIHANDDQAIITASLNNCVNVVRFLLDNGIDVHIRGNEALISAIEEENIDIVRLLLEYNADISARNNMPIKRAKRTNNKEIIELLKMYGAIDNTPLTIVPTVEHDNNYWWDKSITYDQTRCMSLTVKHIQCKNKPVRGSNMCWRHKALD